MDKMAATNCADKNDYATAKTAVCPKIGSTVSATACATPLTKAETCQSQFQSATFTCNGLGVTDSTDTCAVDVLLGVFCVAAMNNNNCASAQCMYSTDCPTDWSCNTQTGRCFNQSFSCPGLPCQYSTDCPTNQTCNSGTGQCNRN
jgi:hypothetical protein